VATKIVKNHAQSLNSLHKTTKSSNNGSRLPKLHLWGYQDLNRIISSEDKLSTSMQCSHCCTIFPLLKRTLDIWDLPTYTLEDLNQQKGCTFHSPPIPAGLARVLQDSSGLCRIASQSFNIGSQSCQAWQSWAELGRAWQDLSRVWQDLAGFNLN